MSFEWTISTLKEHIIALLAEMDKRNAQRFDAQESAVTSALASTREAIAKAETATEKRFESVNEFRSTLTDQAQEFVRRNEVDARLSSLNDKIELAARKLDTMDGSRSGLHSGWGYLVGAVGAVTAVVSVVVLLMRR